MAEDRVQRKLAAILVADVVGYSRLMGEDEEGTLATLTAHLTELIEPSSLHAAAAIPNLLVLEHQFDESPLFMDLCPGTVPVIENGVSPLPAGPGMGFQLPEAGENGR